MTGGVQISGKYENGLFAWLPTIPRSGGETQFDRRISQCLCHLLGYKQNYVYESYVSAGWNVCARLSTVTPMQRPKDGERDDKLTCWFSHLQEKIALKETNILIQHCSGLKLFNSASVQTVSSVKAHFWKFSAVISNQQKLQKLQPSEWKQSTENQVGKLYNNIKNM